MKAVRLAVVIVMVLGGAAWLRAQTSPNLENGWKPYGSYDGSRLDTVNLMNGNLMLHAPIMPDVPQRGSLKVSYALYGTSKDWQTVCFWNQTTQQWQCAWQKGGGSVNVTMTPATLIVHRTLDYQYSGGQGTTTTEAYGYSITSPDGATHQLHGVAGTEDINGEATQFDSIDLSGYRLAVSSSANNGYFDQSTVTDRAGNQYKGIFGGPTNCGRITFAGLSAPGGHPPIFDDAPAGDRYCSQAAWSTLVTDSNGNQISLFGPLNQVPATDTLGKNPPLSTGMATSDYTGCVSSHPFSSSIASALIYYYQDPNGVTQQIKLCPAEVPIQTAFNQPNPYNTSVNVGEAATPAVHFVPLVSVVLADGTYWTFDYDNYGELSSIRMPTGGSIHYTWTTVDFHSCASNGLTAVSRAVLTRTLDDGQGHTYQWNYHWGTPSSTSLTNVVTDPANNDTAHIFTALSPGGPNSQGCDFYETSTITYQGLQAANHPLQRVDTTYSSAMIDPDVPGSNVANVFATDVVTTVYPSGRVKKIHKDPDAGLGAGLPIFGNVKKELEYDWGPGAPGPLLRETDTTYQWETNSAYLASHLIDLPASVIVRDSSGNRVAETDYTYDEPGYLTTPTPAIDTHHVSPPYGLRGNLTTVSRWLNATNSFVSSHTNWYDTGEVYQATDALGHTTTHTYDPFYIGAYATQTCSPATNNVAHCVSRTYDFNSGLLTSLSNENATTQASGNTPGDTAHTSNYSYDAMFRLTSAQAPPDPSNGGLNATTSFNFSAPNAFPVNVQRSKSITTALTDSATSFFDGLGRSYQSQHVLPNGTATVDTTFDVAGHAATVSNPYFSTSDATYGSTTSLFDGLDRVYQTTKQDGSISSVAYNVVAGAHDIFPGANTLGNCTDTVDEAGKQRRACSDSLGRLVEVDEPNVAAPATYAQGSVTINGVEQPTPLPALPGTGYVDIGGDENDTQVCTDPDPPASPVCSSFPDHGTVSIQIGSYPAKSVSFGPGSTSQTIASALASAFHTDTVAPADAVISPANSSRILFTARGTGLATNYSISVNPTQALAPDFWATPSGATLTGARDSSGSPDSGSVTITVNGTSYSTTYGGNDTGSSIATRLATAIGNGAWANASASGGTVNLTAKTLGAAGNHSISGSSSYDTAHFAQPSFTASPSAAALFGGYDAGAFDNSPYRTLYAYDALGNLLQVDQKGSAPNDSTQWRTRTFTYDSLSRLLTANNPESGTITYSYDADGNLLQKTSPAPNQTGTATQTVSYCYDELHRVTGKGYGAENCPLSTPVVTYAYDSGDNAKGHLTSLTDQAGTASYTYDILGRLTAETRTLTGANNASISKNLSYSYNLNGSLKSLTYPSGNVVTYTPDSAGRTLSAIDSGNGINYVTGATYGPDGALTGFVSGNSPSFTGITNAFSYNKRLQPLAMSASAPSQTVFSIGYDFHLGNGDNGNVFGITNYKDQNRNQTFAYDALNRLISAQNAGTDCGATLIGGKSEYWGNSYGYDAWGNLLQKSITKCGAENLSVTADAHNWIHAAGTDYQYDAAGNMTYDATASLSYNFDPENRLTGAAGYTYTYDGDGNRVRKSNASTGTLYWYMTPGIVGESDLSGNLTDEYVFFDGERVARKSTNGVFYYFSDHLKTASVITDAAGTIKSESDFYPWGGELQFVANDSNHYKFTGKERDSETQLDYFGARYYSNGLGRWVSADWSPTPIPVPYADFHDPQSLNLYGFVGGNPASKADPDGHADDNKSLWQQIVDATNSFGDALQHAHMGGSAAIPPPQPCACPNQQKQDNKQNNNNSNQQNTKAADQAKTNAAKGAASEKKVLAEKGLTKNTEKVSGTEGKSIPDFQDKATVGEIKDANQVSNTKQLRIQKEAAEESGRQHELVTGTNTHVTDNAAKGTNVTRRDDLGPKEPK